MDENTKETFNRILAYTADNGLVSAKKALSSIGAILHRYAETVSDQERFDAQIAHAVEVCSMLIDLHMDLTKEEEDILLSAVVLHIYPENIYLESRRKTLVEQLGFPEEVYKVIAAILPGRDWSDEKRRQYFDRVQQNKLGLLAILADRGNTMQKLYQFSTWDAHRYIHETRAYYLPMCIYGKEHYHSLLGPLNVLMEKMRCLMEVSEILLHRYEVREAELMQDILALREENATIYGIIRKFQEE